MIRGIVIMVFLLTLSYNCVPQSKLEKAKKELIEGNDKTRERSESTSYDSNSYSSSLNLQNDPNAIIGVFQAFYYVGVISYRGLFGNYEREAQLHNSLTHYPYYNKYSGNYEPYRPTEELPRSVRFDIHGTYLRSLSDKISGGHLKAKFRPSHTFFFQTDYYQLWEYNDIEDNYSRLSLVNLDFCYDRIRWEKMNLGWTLGALYVGSGVDRVGLSLGVNTEVFLFRSLSIYSSYKGAKINEQQINQFEVELKVYRRNHFISVGYEHLKIASPKFNFMALGAGIYL